jgi:hypothetical protein
MKDIMDDIYFEKLINKLKVEEKDSIEANNIINLFTKYESDSIFYIEMDEGILCLNVSDIISIEDNLMILKQMIIHVTNIKKIYVTNKNGCYKEINIKNKYKDKNKDIIRLMYEYEVSGIKLIVDKMKHDNISIEKIARYMYEMRRSLGIKYKYKRPKSYRRKIFKRNLEKYHNQFGPLYINFFDLDIKDPYNFIIESSTRVNPDYETLKEKYKFEEIKDIEEMED